MDSKIKFKISILTILTAMLLYIVTPNNLFTTTIVSANDVGKSSTIGGIEVGKLKGDELKSLLESAIVEWQSKPLEVKGGGSSLQLDRSLIPFDIENTVLTYNSMTDKPWYAFWQGDKVVHLPLAMGNSQPVIDALSSKPEWDIQETASKIMSVASLLKNDPVEAIVTDTSQFESERIAVTIQPIPETAQGVYALATKLDRTVVGPGEVFSLVEKGAEAVNQTNEEGLSFVASLLFNNALYTNTEIVEHHPQKKVPTYLEPGLEALASLATNENLQFINRSEQPMLLKFTVESNNLKAEVFASTKVDSVSVRVVQAEEVNPREIVRYSKDLAIGRQQVLQEGSKGLRVFVYRTINGEEDEPIRNYYAPVNRILLKSARVPVGETGGQNPPSNSPGNNNDKDLNIDLDGDGLPDVESNADGSYVDSNGNKVAPEGWYYDKSGELKKK